MAKPKRNLLDLDRTQAVGQSRAVLSRHLARLKATPDHGNRTLHIDQLLKALLLSFYDPLCRSLRRIEDHGDFAGQIDLSKLARSTTSDALSALDPQLLEPLLADLLRRVPQCAAPDAELAGITQQIIAADGTYLTTIADVAWALHHTKSNGRRQAQVRANVQMDVRRWTPVVLTVSGDDEQGEPAAFAPDLLADVLYVVDRNFLDFKFLNRLLTLKSNVVLRIKSKAPAYEVLGERPLTDADTAANVTSDQTVRLTGRDAPHQALRLVTIHTVDRHEKPLTIQLLTSLAASDIPAHAVGSVYRLRWQIELFFKWLKTFARMDHLLSTSRRGITFQLYTAVIAVLMMHLQSGHRVSVYSLSALSWVARGEMSMQQALEVIARRERERELNRLSQARRRVAKKIV